MPLRPSAFTRLAKALIIAGVWEVLESMPKVHPLSSRSASFSAELSFALYISL